MRAIKAPFIRARERSSREKPREAGTMTASKRTSARAILRFRTLSDHHHRYIQSLFLLDTTPVVAAYLIANASYSFWRSASCFCACDSPTPAVLPALAVYWDRQDHPGCEREGRRRRTLVLRTASSSCVLMRSRTRE